MSVNIKNGTPMHGPSLCETCERAHIVKGYRESELVVVCRATYVPQIRVTFPVRECSSYVSQGRKNLDDMEEIAWVLGARGSKRQAGFGSPDGSIDEPSDGTMDGTTDEPTDERESELVLEEDK
jgi:hypothetical protein